METHSLENCIDVLKKIVDAYSSQLDTSILVELNEVIHELKKVHERRTNRAELGRLSLRSLQIIAVVIRLVTDVEDWMK